jgi:hypothetical protein
MRQLLGGSLLCGLLTLVWAPAAQAYVPPADALCRMLAEVRRAPQVRDVSLQLTADVQGHDSPVEKRLYFKKPERMRVVQQDDVVLTSIYREGLCVSLENKVLKAGPLPADQLLPVLYFPRGSTIEDMAGRVLAALQAADVDTHVTALGRQAEAVAYIIGARDFEPDRPQVWLDKATLQPIRVVTLVKGAQADQAPLRRELRLLEYGSSVCGNSFARVYEVYEDGTLVRRAEVTAARFNQDLPESLFDLGSRRR